MYRPIFPKGLAKSNTGMPSARITPPITKKVLFQWTYPSFVAPLCTHSSYCVAHRLNHLSPIKDHFEGKGNELKASNADVLSEN